MGYALKSGLFLLGALGLLLIAGCNAGNGAAPAPPTLPTPSNPISSASKAATSTSLTPSGVARPVLVSSELVIGPNRFVFGLVDANTGVPVPDVAQVQLQFFKVNDDGTATKTGDANVVYQSKNLPAGVYVAQSSFEKPGNWGALMTIKRPGKNAYQVKANFTVEAKSALPNVGDPAPASKNLTQRDVKDLSEICSTVPRDDMHDWTIADAAKSGKPTFIIFATPGYCETGTCGPDMQLAQVIEAKYRGKANFIHIETPGASPQAPRAQEPTVIEWKLKTEPWIYFLDKTGKVFERFEGGLTLDEVGPAFDRLMQQS